jgi:uncharacterized protein (TIGR03435 family)
MYRIILIGIATGVAFAQTSPRVEFDVASIRPSPQLSEQVSLGLHLDGAQVRYASLSLKNYIASAYRVKPYQISAHDWSASQRFNIAATLPAGSTQAQIPEMLQALLTDRFQIKMHREKRELPVYALELGKGPLKLKETPPDADTEKGDAKGGVNVAASGSGAGIGVNLGNGSSYTFANNRFEARKLTMTVLSANLERFMDRPILDATGLKGNYDLALDISPEDYRAMLIRAAISEGVVLPAEALRALEGGSPGSLFDALQKLGLRLDPRKAPLDILVIDQAQKSPTEN